MDEKTIMNDGASVTEFDAENIQTDKEKRRDGISEEDIRKGDWGGKPAPADSPAAPLKVQDPIQNRKTRNGR